MASITQFPSPESYGDWREWANAITDVLSKHLGSIPNVPVGHIILHGGSTPPTGYLKCDGSSFDGNTYPALANRLGQNVLPTITPAAGLSYAIRAR